MDGDVRTQCGGAPIRGQDVDHRFLQAEGITVVGGDTGGGMARRVRYWPTTGQAQQRLLADADPTVFVRERKLAVAPPAPAADQGDLELF